MSEHTIPALMERIEQLLAIEEARTNVETIEDYHFAVAAHTTLEALREDINQHLDNVGRRIWRLPILPTERAVEHAQALLSVPLAVLVIETTSLDRNADILRVCILEQHGEMLYDSLVRPTRHITSNERYTHLTLDEVMNAPTFDVVYEAILSILAYRHVIAFGAEFVKSALINNAKHHILRDVPPLLMDDMQDEACHYFRVNFINLSVACARVGYDITQHRPAPERAQAILALLSGMAQGKLYSEPKPTVTVETPVGDIDEHPF